MVVLLLRGLAIIKKDEGSVFSKVWEAWTNIISVCCRQAPPEGDKGLQVYSRHLAVWTTVHLCVE